MKHEQLYLPPNEGEFWNQSQILRHVVKNMSEKDIEEVLKTPSANGMIDFHSSVGRYIRNRFKLWINNPHLNGMHPDDFSFEILKDVWYHVQRRERFNV